MLDSTDPLVRPERLDALVRIGLLDTDPEPAFDRLARLAASLLGAPMVTISFVDDRREFVKSGVSHGSALPLREVPLAASFARFPVSTGRPFVVNDVHAVEELAGHAGVETLGVLAYVGVPLRVDGVPIGAIGALGTERRAWSEKDLALLIDVACAVETEIELRRVQAQHRRQGRILEAAFRYLGDGVLLVDRDGDALGNAAGEWTLSPRDGASERSTVTLFRADGTACRAGELPLDRVLTDGITVREELLVRGPRDREGRWHEVVAAQVDDADGSVAGAFCVVRETPGAGEGRGWRERSAPVITSPVDAVTGVYDRRAFETVARERMSASRRERRSLLLYLVRVDGVDGIRERLGPGVAEQAVQDVADAIRSAANESDILGRLAGDAFAVVAQDGGHAEAARRLGRIQLAIAEKNSDGARPYAIAVRCGVAAWDAGGAVGLDQLLLRADASARERARPQVSA